MYVEHDEFHQPEDENVKVWRYMDLSKLVSLLDSSALFFTRADKLGDPFEGSLPIDHVVDQFNCTGKLGSDTEWRRYVAVSCWHMNNHESAAMWKLYLKSDEGIAIQSSYKKLRESIIDTETVHLGKVSYIDYETDRFNSPFDAYEFAPYIHKRKSFEHEREVRAVIKRIPTGFDHTIETISDGIAIDTDITLLIEQIKLAPKSPKWILRVVESVVSRYGLICPVSVSDMDKAPIF